LPVLDVNLIQDGSSDRPALVRLPSVACTVRLCPVNEPNFADTPLHRERRAVTVTKLEYAPDGTIKMLPWWIARASRR